MAADFAHTTEADKWQAHLEALNSHLTLRTFCVGHRLSLADVALWHAVDASDLGKDVFKKNSKTLPHVTVGTSVRQRSRDRVSAALDESFGADALLSQRVCAKVCRRREEAGCEDESRHARQPRQDQRVGAERVHAIPARAVGVPPHRPSQSCHAQRTLRAQQQWTLVVVSCRGAQTSCVL
jgi:hypothetical protein